jgi:hypothetical protein
MQTSWLQDLLHHRRSRHPPLLHRQSLLWRTPTADATTEEVAADEDTTTSASGFEVSRAEPCASFCHSRETDLRRAEDDDYDQGFRNQRPRQEPPPGTRIRRGLLEIAEDAGRLPHKVAADLAKLTADNYEDDFVRETFSTVALKLAVEQPFKIPFVAAVVLYANAEKSQIAQDIITKAGSQLQDALDAGRWKDVKLLLRFLACLSQLFEQDGILPILDELFSRAADLQTASSEDVSSK